MGLHFPGYLISVKVTHKKRVHVTCYWDLFPRRATSRAARESDRTRASSGVGLINESSEAEEHGKFSQYSDKAGVKIILMICLASLCNII